MQTVGWRGPWRNKDKLMVSDCAYLPTSTWNFFLFGTGVDDSFHACIGMWKDRADCLQDVVRVCTYRYHTGTAQRSCTEEPTED